MLVTCVFLTACGSGSNNESKTPAVNACGAAVTATTSSCGGAGETTVASGPTAASSALSDFGISTIPQASLTLGAPGAPLTINLYQNFLCPHCRDFALDMFPQLIADYVATGKVDVVFHDAAFGGGPANVAHEAAHCAADQGKFWPAYFALYQAYSDDSATYTNARMESALEPIGVDNGKLASCLESHQHLAEVEAATTAFQQLADNNAAYASALATVTAAQGPAIPMLDVGGTYLTAPEDYETVKAAIDAKLGP
ncbi:MAG TPA: thioredoxin domain-containing protein [Candidatus Limnocylindria bacterium]|nr:thioredoxin domain-containing protein [Candidatus Limnocylindria bacterium]